MFLFILSILREVVESVGVSKNACRALSGSAWLMPLTGKKRKILGTPTDGLKGLKAVKVLGAILDAETAPQTPRLPQNYY
jgi:hypothetical protein